MKYEKISYVITDGKYYIFDVQDKEAYIPDCVEDFLNMPFWSTKEKAEEILSDFINGLNDYLEIEKFKDFYIKPIKITFEV